MLLLLIIIVGITVSTLTIVWVLLFFMTTPKRALKIRPFVSVLVAARNEEENISACIEALKRVNYPVDHFEVLIGNDESTDKTAAIVADAIKETTNFRLIDIAGYKSRTKGKSRVLARLAKEAKGDYFFITDADTSVPQEWIYELLGAFNEKTGIVTGVTLPQGKGIIGAMQAIDWAFAITLVKAMEILRLPVTSMGNNMAIRREVYEEVGGYETLPFSITEDYQLFRAVLKRGYGFKQLFNLRALASTVPVTNVKAILHQRKRWMFGAVQLPWYMLSILFFNGIVYSALLVMFILNWRLALIAFVFKAIVHIAVLIRSLVHFRKGHLLFLYLIWEVYSALLSTVLLIYYALPTKVNWKGRMY